MTPDTLVDDYSISQTTLDQVFINFAGEQSDDPLRAMKSQQALTKLYSRTFSRAVLNRATSRGQIILDAPDDSRQARRASTIGRLSTKFLVKSCKILSDIFRTMRTMQMGKISLGTCSVINEPTIVYC